jgi:hypothetical protein
MRAAHLHTRAGNRPQRFVDVDLGPLRGAQFTWPDKRQRQQLKAAPNFRRAVVAIDRSKQFAERRWVNYRRAGAHGRRD